MFCFCLPLIIVVVVVVVVVVVGGGGSGGVAAAAVVVGCKVERWIVSDDWKRPGIQPRIASWPVMFFQSILEMKSINTRRLVHRPMNQT